MWFARAQTVCRGGCVAVGDEAEVGVDALVGRRRRDGGRDGRHKDTAHDRRDEEGPRDTLDEGTPAEQAAARLRRAKRGRAGRRGERTWWAIERWRAQVSAHASSVKWSVTRICLLLPGGDYRVREMLLYSYSLVCGVAVSYGDSARP